jgi:hypothetical protein
MPRRTVYIREDMMKVTVNDDPVPWDKAQGGDVVTRSTRRTIIEDLALERIRRDDGVPAIVRLTKHVGDRAIITLEHLDMDGSPTGSGVVYEGTLIVVAPADYNANGSSVAKDRIVLRPTKLYSLGDQYNATSCLLG